MRRRLTTTSISLPNLFTHAFSVVTSYTDALRLRPTFRSFSRPKWIFPLNNYVGIFLVILMLLLSYYLGTTFGRKTVSYQDDRPSGAIVKARQVLNKELAVPLKDAKGKEIARIKYLIENAELQDSIIVKGQRARAVKGRTFLILNLKISNNHDQTIEINSRDYIRLFANSKKDAFAADIHNDPVQVQAISSKQTRLGFPINDADKNLTLQIGEIKGKKETVKLDLKKI